MALKKTFVLSDESVNSYGFWIVSSGLDLSGVQKNCPLYYEHRTWEIPCGHVENIRLKDGKILGDIVIEGGNDIEKEYIRKIENGDIKGCSMGVEPIEWSEDLKLLKPGQTRPTLTKGAPYELSLAPLPGNKNALGMRHGNDMITLSADKNYDFIPSLNIEPEMKELALLLGLSANATEQEIAKAVQAVQLKAAHADAMQKVIEDHVAVKLEGDKKTFFVELAKTDIKSAMSFLSLNKAPETENEEKKGEEGKEAKVNLVKDKKVSELIQLGKNAEDKAKEGKDCFDYYQRHDTVELARIKREEPEKYTKLVADYAKGVRYTAGK
ncbi:MAG: hypothetical protein ACTHK8_19005 [Ginsengibacter sp.]